MEFIYLCGVSKDIGADSMSHFFTYYRTLLLPIICTESIPELKNKFQKVFPC